MKKKNAGMYYWILKINVSRDNPSCCALFLFHRKMTKKSTKNLSKIWHWKLIFLLEVIACEHVGTQGKLAPGRSGTLAREACKECWHVSTQETLPREHISTQDTLHREHVSMQGTLIREYVSTLGTLPREYVSI